MIGSVLLALVLTVASIDESKAAAPPSFAGWLADLRALERVDGCAVGAGGTRGRFFVIARRILKDASLADYRRMLTDPYPVVRVMGILGIVLQHPEATDETTPLLGDSSRVEWLPFGCEVERLDVGRVVRILLKKPTVLGVTATGAVADYCK